MIVDLVVEGLVGVEALEVGEEGEGQCPPWTWGPCPPPRCP